MMEARVFTPEATCIKNLSEINKFLKQNDSTDFILLQEVDKTAKGVIILMNSIL